MPKMTTVADDGGEAGVEAGVEAGGEAGSESGSDDSGITRDDGKHIVNDTDEEEIQFPNATKMPAARNAFIPTRSSRSILTPGRYDELLSNFNGPLKKKIPMYQQWAQDTLKNTTLGGGSMEMIIKHVRLELQKDLVYDNVKAVLRFWLEATKNPRFHNAVYRPTTVLELVQLPAAIFKQKRDHRKLLTKAIVRLLDITSNHVHFYVKREIMKEMHTTNKVYIMEHVLPIVLKSKLDLTKHATIAQIKSVLLNAEKLKVIKVSDALDLYGENFDEDVKQAILAASPLQQTWQYEIFSDESPSLAPRDQSSHAQPLTPPHQRSPPNLQDKLAEGQMERRSQMLTSAPAAYVVEHHGDTPPPPSASMEALSLTRIPELLYNEPISSDPQDQSRKRRNQTNFASNKKPQNKILSLSPRTGQAIASGSHARPVASHPRPAGQPHISEILSALNDRPFNYIENFNVTYCGHGDSGILESYSSAPTFDNQELVDREIDADDGHDDADYDDAGHDDSGHESVDIRILDDEHDVSDYGSDEVDSDGF